MPLRPDLYNRLVARFPGGVIIANEGEEMSANVGERNGRKSLEVSHAGEEYRLNCPMCGETRHRLYINHMWGRRVDGIPGLNLHLAICFNETNCMAQEGRAYELYRRIFGDVRSQRPDDILLKGETVPPVVPESPGLVYNLAHLPPDHPACLYVRKPGRSFDAAWLGQVFSIGYVYSASARFYLAAERLYIPIMLSGKLMGWQARYLGDPVPDGVAKYYGMPGMEKRKLLYSYDLARTRPFVVICEGATDVWKIGPEAVAVFGKTLSPGQLDLLAAGAASRPSWVTGGNPGWEAAVILLDGEASQKASALEKPSDADKMADQLSAIPKFKGRTVVIRLPHGVDPGGLDTVYLRQLLAARLADAGLSLPV